MKTSFLCAVMALAATGLTAVPQLRRDVQVDEGLFNIGKGIHDTGMAVGGAIEGGANLLTGAVNIAGGAVDNAAKAVFNVGSGAVEAAR
ncbi:hypothetical protein NQ176_g11143 [Zarea fungicola]|uniref:Uncharacterized protein n=1 Tax=Zarea fungicola TaxID=93591 RepID=A0ACC1MC52_9HYPO|nr:hypothetical protein NQ176_g11143 [Lecanicillium fungicola]